MAKINDLNEAVRFFIHECLRGEGQTVSHVPGSRGPIAYRVRHPVTVRSPATTGNELIVEVFFQVFFKRSWFRSFQYYFNLPKGFGIGQTVNMKALQTAAGLDDILVIVMPDASVYEIPAREFSDFVLQYATIRNPSTERSLEGSVPARMLKPFNYDNYSDGNKILEFRRRRHDNNDNNNDDDDNNNTVGKLDDFFKS